MYHLLGAAGILGRCSRRFGEGKEERGGSLTENFATKAKRGWGQHLLPLNLGRRAKHKSVRKHGPRGNQSTIRMGQKGREICVFFVVFVFVLWVNAGWGAERIRHPLLDSKTKKVVERDGMGGNWQECWQDPLPEHHGDRDRACVQP